MEGRVLMEGRAEIAQPRVWLTGDPLTQVLQQARFADARFAGDQDGLPLAGSGPLPAVQKYRQFLLTADQGCRASAVKRLEPASGAAFANHTPRGDRAGKALGVDRTKLGELKEPAEQPPRRVGDDYGAGFGERLQAGGEIGRVAHHRLFLGGAYADQVPDHH